LTSSPNFGAGLRSARRTDPECRVHLLGGLGHRLADVRRRTLVRLASRNGCCCGRCPGFSATSGERAETKLQARRERRHNDGSRDGVNAAVLAPAYRRWQLASASTLTWGTSTAPLDSSAINVQVCSNHTTPINSNRAIANHCTECLAKASGAAPRRHPSPRTGSQTNRSR
jgi:hypothetical protein